MNVAWALFWGGSRSTKPCVFPCKVAAAGDERYLVCAAVAAAVVWFLLCVLQQWLGVVNSYAHMPFWGLKSFFSSLRDVLRGRHSTSYLAQVCHVFDSGCWLS